MSRASKLVGKTMTHPDFGKVEVTGVKNGSRTIVEIQVVQRAKGWDEASQTYKPVKSFVPNRDINGKEIGKTFRQKTYSDRHSGYGDTDEVHFNTLSEI